MLSINTVTPDDLVATLEDAAVCIDFTEIADQTWHALVHELVNAEDEVQGVLLYVPGATFSKLLKHKEDL